MNDSSWDQSLDAPAYPQLTGDADADVVVIGGGLAGVLCAYTIFRSGKSVILIEKDTLGGGATMRTTAFLTQAIDTGLSDLVTMYGTRGARLVWQSGQEAIAQIGRIVRDQGMASEFIPCVGRVYARTESEYRALQKEAAVARQLGFAVTVRRDDDLHFPNEGYLEIPDQAKFHPLKFLRLLAAHCAQAGVHIYEHTTATTLSEAGQVVVTTDSGATIRATDAIVATYLPFNNPKPTHFKKGPYRSYAMEVRVKHGSIPEGIYWDLSRPYNYFRVDRTGDEDRIILGGADHRSDLPVSQEKSFRAVERYLHSVIGSATYQVVRRWSGTIVESSDGLPLIGAYAPHRYVATAFSGNGMTYAMVSAMLIRDRIHGVQNPWEALYDPRRPLKFRRLLLKGRDYLQEFFGGAVRNSVR